MRKRLSKRTREREGEGTKEKGEIAWINGTVHAICMYYSLTFIIIDIMHRTIFHS